MGNPAGIGTGAPTDLYRPARTHVPAFGVVVMQDRLDSGSSDAAGSPSTTISGISRNQDVPDHPAEEILFIDLKNSFVSHTIEINGEG